MGKGQGCQGADLLPPNSMSRKISYTDWRRPCTSDFSQDASDALNSGKCTSGFWGLAEESGLYRDKRQNLGTWVQRCGSKRKGTLQVVPHLKWLTCGFPSPHFLWLENDVPCRAITALPCIWPRCWGSLVLCLRTKEVPPRIPATLGSGSFRLVCNKAVKNLGKQQAPALTHTMCIFYTYTHIYLQILHMYIHIYTHNIYTHVTHT